MYDTVGWLEKNKDELLLNLRELLISSDLPFISDILFENDKKGYLAGNLGNMKQKSQSGQFRQQLDSLMTTLFQTQPQYIRCVKPNQLKVKELFDAPICLQQLRYAGVFEAVQIRQQGFPFRWTHEVFYTRYRILGGPAHTGKVSLSRVRVCPRHCMVAAACGCRAGAAVRTRKHRLRGGTRSSARLPLLPTRLLTTRRNGRTCAATFWMC